MENQKKNPDLSEILDLGEKADLSLDFVVPLKLISHWKKCSLVSDFFSDYQSYYFNNSKKIMSILSTVINELLENAVKYTSDPNKLVTTSLKQYNKNISIETINITDKKNAEKLSKSLKKIKTKNLERLFFEQIEFAAKNDKNASGLGLISLAKDYNATLSVSVNKKDDNHFEVHMKATLPTELLDTI